MGIGWVVAAASMFLAPARRRRIVPAPNVTAGPARAAPRQEYGTAVLFWGDG